MVTIVPPAHGVWLDLGTHTERILEPGGHELGGGEGFVWVDVELPAPEAVAALAAAALVPAGVAADPEAAGAVGSAYGAEHLQLSLTGARLDGDGLVLDRREIVVTPGAVVTLHRGLPTHFEDLRERYRDGFPRFARTHGFLLYELVGHLTDGLQGVVRGLGDRIDELRMAAALPGRRTHPADGSDLLASVLVMRRVLARTRDLLSEISSRRSPFVPETTQPYLHDVADRVDGLVADLAFSRDVLDEALRLADAGPAEEAPAPAATVPPEPHSAAPGRPPVAIASLGGFEASRGGVPVAASELGGERARELLAALLAARRPVGREQLLAWLWPGEPADRATRALSESLAGLRRALDPPEAPGATGLIAAEGSTCRAALGPDDSWDVRRPPRPGRRGPRPRRARGGAGALRAAVLPRVAARRLGPRGARGLRARARGAARAARGGAAGRRQARRGDRAFRGARRGRPRERGRPPRRHARRTPRPGGCRSPSASSTPAARSCARPRASTRAPRRRRSTWSCSAAADRRGPAPRARRRRPPRAPRAPGRAPSR